MRLHLFCASLPILCCQVGTNVTFCTYVDVAAVAEFAMVAFIVVEQDTLLHDLWEHC